MWLGNKMTTVAAASLQSQTFLTEARQHRTEIFYRSVFFLNVNYICMPQNLATNMNIHAIKLVISLFKLTYHTDTVSAAARREEQFVTIFKTLSLHFSPDWMGVDIVNWWSALWLLWINKEVLLEKKMGNNLINVTEQTTLTACLYAFKLT